MSMVHAIQERLDPIRWLNKDNLESKGYICGYCDHSIASNVGYRHEHGTGHIYICHYCGRPTFFTGGGFSTSQTPEASFGEGVGYLDHEVDSLYQEARACLKVGANTASVLCSRKLLMNIAVSKGAKQRQDFTYYIDWLEKQRYLPPDGKEWADHIRRKGNEATHKIKIMSREDAEELITFLQMLLRFIFEYPAVMKSKTNEVQQVDAVSG